jgi:hypothetical protein
MTMNIVLILVSLLLLVIICEEMKTIRYYSRMAKTAKHGRCLAEKSLRADLALSRLYQIKPYDWQALIDFHKYCAAEGVTGKSLGPDMDGMFRVHDIRDLDKENVFLGNIDGLWIWNISFWEHNKDEEGKKAVWNQYFSILKSNLAQVKQSPERFLQRCQQLKNESYEL